MIEHRLCDPRPQRLECRPAAAEKECPFCGKPHALKGNQCRNCGVWLPSANSYKDPRRSRYKRQEYTPQTDGLQPDSSDAADELGEYADLLQDIEVDCLEEDQDGSDPADDLPTMQELEVLP